MRRKTESNSGHTIENGDNRLSMGNGAVYHNMVAKNRVFPGSSQCHGEGIRRKPEQALYRLISQSQVIQNPPMRRANTAVNVTSDSLLEIPHRRCQSERHNRSLSIEAFQNKKYPLNQDNLILVKQRSLSQPRCYPPQQKGNTPNTSAKSPLTSRMNLSSQAIHVQSMRLVEKELRNQNIPTTSISPRVRNQRTDIPNGKGGTRTNLPTTTTSTKRRNESNAKRFDAVKPKDCKVER